jgi:trk system potassium uptake protein TrkA
MTFRQGQANLVEITLPESAPYVGRPVRDIPLPHDSALVAILRGKRVVAPTQDDTVEAGDELVFVCTSDVEEEVRAVMLGERT